MLILKQTSRNPKNFLLTYVHTYDRVATILGESQHLSAVLKEQNTKEARFHMQGITIF